MLQTWVYSVFNKQGFRDFFQHKLHLYLCDTQSYVLGIEIGASDLEYALQFTNDSSGCLCVDWGDGQTTRITDFKSVYKHTYASAGKYNILLYHSSSASRSLMIDIKGTGACSTTFQVMGWTWSKRVWAGILLYIFT